jgi:hypothetical protein
MSLKSPSEPKFVRPWEISPIKETKVLDEAGNVVVSSHITSTPKAGISHYDSGYFSSSPSHTPENNRTELKSRKLLNPKAVQLMEQWYLENYDHPYPNLESIERLAAEGEIRVTQVKKWMANKRVRSNNTLSYNQSVHPKRMKSMEKKKSRHVPYPVMDSSETEEHTRFSTLGHKATTILNHWFKQHEHHPYPNFLEKEKLAKQTGLTLTQVNYWFTNKRRRTNPAVSGPDSSPAESSAQNYMATVLPNYLMPGYFMTNQGQFTPSNIYMSPGYMYNLHCLASSTPLLHNVHL